jgi:hypothetical protein
LPGFSVAYQYSLYDALVSINVPSDKARAVVDAMERDMGTTLATKQDLELTRVATKQDFELLRVDFEALRWDMENRFGLVEQRITGLDSRLDQKIDGVQLRLEQKIDTLRSDMARDFAALDLRMTVKLGSMLFVGFGFVIAALRVWAS